MTRNVEIYYYIRNACTHNYFSIVEDIYYFESNKGKDVNVRIFLKESSLKSS